MTSMTWTSVRNTMKILHKQVKVKMVCLKTIPVQTQPMMKSGSNPQWWPGLCHVILTAIPVFTRKPVNYFNLFFTHDFINKVFLKTNLSVYLANPPESRVHQWTKEGQTHLQEMRAFYGICFHIGQQGNHTLIHRGSGNTSAATILAFQQSWARQAW